MQTLMHDSRSWPLITIHISLCAQRYHLEHVLPHVSHSAAMPTRLGCPGALGEVMAQLRSLGFGDSDAQDAVAITIAEGGQPRLEAALDWLCVHVPEPDLPARFAAGKVHPAAPAPSIILFVDTGPTTTTPLVCPGTMTGTP